jgi:TPR repeat protein
MKKYYMLIPFQFMLMLCCSGEVEQNQEFDDTVINMHARAVSGDPEAALFIWHSGKLIDAKNSLKNIAGPFERLSLLKKAADNGHAEACYQYAIFLLVAKNDHKNFLKYIELAGSDNKNVMGVVLWALILRFQNDDREAALEKIAKLKEVLPNAKSDEIDRSITKIQAQWIIDAVAGQDMKQLRDQVTKHDQYGDLRACINYYDLSAKCKGEVVP